MAENSWAERRGRMVKCKIHGLHFDPEMSTGCTLCLRDAGKAQRASRPPQLVLILLCLLGMAGILFYLFGPGRDEATEIIDLGVASTATETPKLDPEAYRAPVIALETVLFQTPLDETEDLLIVSRDVQSAAEDLSDAILRDQPVHGLTAADQIARMGQAIPTDQVVVGDIQRARGQWRRIRQQRFLSVEWFAELSAVGARSTPSIPEYSDVASGVRALVEDAAAEIEALNEPVEELGGDDPALRWRDFARDLERELDTLESRLPTRPGADANGGLLVAIQDLEQALSQARALASSAQPPAVTDTRFDAAINAALRAQQGFDGLAP